MALEKETWHLSKGISVGHIITTALLVVTASMYISSIEEKITINSINIDNLRNSNKEMILRIDTNLNNMNRKIDELYMLLLEKNKQ